MSVIPALGKQKQEDHNFEGNLGYIVRPCIKILKQNKERKRI
jgi:hypothetical protein